MFTSRPIGFVSSPYKDASQVPKGLGAKHEADGVLKIERQRGFSGAQDGEIHRKAICAKLSRHWTKVIVPEPPGIPTRMKRTLHFLALIVVGLAIGAVSGAVYGRRSLGQGSGSLPVLCPGGVRNSCKPRI